MTDYSAQKISSNLSLGDARNLLKCCSFLIVTDCLEKNLGVLNLRLVLDLYEKQGDSCQISACLSSLEQPIVLLNAPEKLSIDALSKLLILQEFNQNCYYVYEEQIYSIKCLGYFLAQQVQSQDRNRIRLSAALSHELRTPLNAIIGFSEIIQKRSLGEGQAAQDRYQEYLGDIQNAGHFLQSLIENMLNIFQMEPEYLEVECKKINVKQEFNTLRRFHGNNATTKNIHILILVSEDIFLWTDPNSLRQILSNLLENAIKFSPKGGEIKLQARSVGHMFQIDVEDQGPGFRITENPTDEALKKAKGSGIGLRLSKMLATSLGGSLSITALNDSETALAGADNRVRGTKITLSIPKNYKSEKRKLEHD